MDTTHLVSLNQRLYSEKSRLSAAKNPQEIALRKVWVAQLEKEIAGEFAFLGMSDDCGSELNADELMAELMA